MARMFNIKHGITVEDDTLPSRMMEPIKSGPKMGKVVNKEEFEAAKKLYYGMMGWDNHAIPAPTKLAELGLFDLMVQEKGG